MSISGVCLALQAHVLQSSRGSTKLVSQGLLQTTKCLMVSPLKYPTEQITTKLSLGIYIYIYNVFMPQNKLHNLEPSSFDQGFQLLQNLIGFLCVISHVLEELHAIVLGHATRDLLQSKQSTQVLRTIILQTKSISIPQQ